jgi:hypothetical protein
MERRVSGRTRRRAMSRGSGEFTEWILDGRIHQGVHKEISEEGLFQGLLGVFRLIEGITFLDKLL